MNKYLTIVLVFLAVQMKVSAQEWKVNKGDKVPAFTVEKKDGTQISINDLKGKVVLLNFFATWCPPCRQELPRLQKEVWDKLGDRSDFTVMVLAREEGWDKLNPFMKSNDYTFPVFPDLNRKVFSLFAEQSIPRNVLVNKDGVIIYQSIGYTPEEFTGLINLINTELKK
ncbi:TlpA family protein disulfide reductase [Sphingobacterium rhinopitheci]|uniref:TlpA family protein disulfide reductase n=1 Tax=Sphingobacterium rhinopitheci TaxID=2781960 RepID=UPI001F519207|nr:TlpA disulfide reductase family protein [Sphingobacterium rhinopitheci]MCI0921045.1 TlpA family protein disulfide reductase [Sphingobacterium rhinopitheci]